MEYLFIPPDDVFDIEIDKFFVKLDSKFGSVLSYDYNQLFSQEVSPADFYIDSQWGNLKILDMSFVIMGVNYFRPYIRGFIALMLVFYHIRQIMATFGWTGMDVSPAPPVNETGLSTVVRPR